MSVEVNNEKAGTEGYYKNLEDVIKKSYYIASYQRGYRWEKHNVEELLEDIFEGKLTEGNIPEENEYADDGDLIYAIKDKIGINPPKYCLQPPCCQTDRR